MKSKNLLLSIIVGGAIVLCGCGTIPSTTYDPWLDSDSEYSEDVSSESGIESTSEQQTSVVVTLTGLDVTEPTKTTYFVGETLDTTGMVVTAKYSDSSENVLASTDYEITGFDSSVAGTNEVTVTYQDVSASFYVIIENPIVVSLDIVPPTKTTYFVGDTLDTTGLEVTANYSDASTLPVSVEDCTIEGFDSSTADEIAVRVIYQGVTGTFNVTIVEPVVTSLDIVGPTKTKYRVGNAFSAEGLTVTANYSNNTQHAIAVSECQFEGFDSTTAGTKEVKVKFGGKEATFTVTVEEIPAAITCTHTFDTEADCATLPAATAEWPRGFSTEQSHDGPGSIKIAPHPSWGTWPTTSLGKYDLTDIETVEMWAYFDSDNDYSNFAFQFVANGKNYKAKITTPSRTWVKYSVPVATVAGAVGDVTEVELKYIQDGSTYPDRSPIFLDSLNLIEEEEPYVSPFTHGFDSAADVASLPTPSSSDTWCWPRAFSTEKVHDGPGALKVTPHPTDGKWSTVNFGVYDLTDAEKVELWLYADSDTALEKMGLMFADESDSSADYTYYKTITGKTWTLYSVDIATIAAKVSDTSKVKIYIGNVGGTYDNRCVIYMDSFNVVAKETPVVPPAIECTHTFDTQADVDTLPTGTAEWPRAYSTEKSHDGAGSLKITPHPSWGTWPTYPLGTYDLTNKLKVEMWAYFDSDNSYSYFGFQFHGNGKQYNKIIETPSRTWVKYEVLVSDILATLGDVSEVTLKYGNNGSNYPDRSPIFLDSLNIVDIPVPEFALAFDTEAECAALPAATAEWPRGFSTEQVHDGTGSLKITPHPSWGTWPTTTLGTFNLTDVEKVEMWAYFDSDNDYSNFAFQFVGTGGNLKAKITTPSRTWVKYTVYTADIVAKTGTLEEVTLKYIQDGSTYPDRSPIFLDSVKFVAKAAPVVSPFTHGFDTAEDVASLPTPSESSSWCWPRAFTEELAHDGAGSIKITPHPTDGTWPTLEFGVYDLTGISKVELWLYADSDTALENMAIMFADEADTKADYSYYKTITGKTWTLYSVDVSTIATKVADTTKVKIYIGNVGSTYANRCNLYLDSFNLLAANS